MNTLADAKELLLGTEKSLKLLVAKAANDGEYDAVLVLAEWARTLNHLRDSASLPAPANGGAKTRGRNGRPTNAHSRANAVAQKSAAAARQSGASAEYPQFVRENDALVKIAWSKSSKSQYEHKAPKQALALLIQALARQGAGRLISMDRILPLRDTEGVELPAYQAYLALAWLRKTGLVVQHGRQGYSLKQGIDLQPAAEMLWEQLPTRPLESIMPKNKK